MFLKISQNSQENTCARALNFQFTYYIVRNLIVTISGEKIKNIKKKAILENALKVLPDIINEIFSAIMDKAY